MRDIELAESLLEDMIHGLWVLLALSTLTVAIGTQAYLQTSSERDLLLALGAGILTIGLVVLGWILRRVRKLILRDIAGESRSVAPASS